MFKGDIETVVKLEAASLCCAQPHPPKFQVLCFIYSLRPRKSTPSIITLSLCLLQDMVSCRLVSTLKKAGSNHDIISAHNFERPYKRPSSLLTFSKLFREYSEWFAPANSRLLRPDGILF